MEAQQWYQVAAQEYLESSKRDPMNAALFLPLARSLAILGENKASAQALARYRELMPMDAKVEFGDLPQKEVADVGIVVDYAAELRALPQVTPPLRPALPMFPHLVNVEMQQRMVSAGDTWKSVLDDLLHSQWQKATDALAAMRAVPGDWLRDYLLATLWLWRDDAEKAETAARQLKPVAEKNPAVEMLRWDIYRQLSYDYFQKLLDEYPEAALGPFFEGTNAQRAGKAPGGGRVEGRSRRRSHAT